MHIALSKRVEGQTQHVVVVCEGNDMLVAAPVIAEIMPRGFRPVRKHDPRNGKYRYLFNMSFLDDLLLALPQASKSTGLQRRLDRINARRMDKRSVPPFPIPGLWDRKFDVPAKGYDHQYIAIQDCVKFMMGEMDEEQTEHFLENDEMGLGKTFIILCALAIIRDRLGRDIKVLWVAPKNGKFVVERENDRWIGFDLQVVDADLQVPAEREAAIRKRASITTVNPEMLRGQYPDLFNFKYDIIVLDEFHRFGSPDSQQTRGMMNLQTDRFLPASGTPYLNRPTQLWPILHRCWPDKYPDYDSFKRAIEIVDRGSGRVVGYRPKVASAVREHMEPRSIRRRRDQVLAGLPPVMPVDLPIELNREQRRIYNKIRDAALLELEDGSMSNIRQQAVTLRLKQACFSPELFGGSKHSSKVDELIAFVEAIVAANEKVLIFSEWSKATRILKRDLAQWKPAYVDGSVTGANRMQQADYFNGDEDCRIYIGTIGANREAVSLGAATTVVFTDKDPSPFVCAQAAGRSAAGGIRGANAVVDKIQVATMFGVDTYEEKVEEDISWKQAFSDQFIERDGGKKAMKIKVRSLRDMLL